MEEKSPPPAYETMDMSQNYPEGQPAMSSQPVYIVQPSAPPASTVVIAPTGANSSRMTCPRCKSEINTRVTKTASCKAWLSCLGIAICCSPCFCFLGCCLIPCCMDDCNNIKHTCPKCKTFLGERRA